MKIGTILSIVSAVCLAAVVAMQVLEFSALSIFF
jgi:hypothetical protein